MQVPGYGSSLYKTATLVPLWKHTSAVKEGVSAEGSRDFPGAGPLGSSGLVLEGCPCGEGAAHATFLVDP